MINHYSCCTYVNNEAKFIETRLCKHIYLTVVLFDKKRS